MTRRAIRATVAAGLCLLLVAPAVAQESANPQDVPVGERAQLDAIRQNLVDLEFEKALAALDALLARPGMSEALRGEALVLRAQTHVAYGDLDAAENDYREILQVRPSWSPDPSLVPQKALQRFEKARKSTVGRVLVEVDPPDARLLVDGREVATGPDGALFVLAGDHVVRAERPGYDAESRPVAVEAGSEHPVRFALVPNARTVVVSTEPDDVEVWVDGERFGRTRRPPGLSNLPATLELPDLPLGDHVFELRKDCHRTEQVEEFLSVDLLDRSPRRLPLVRLTPSGATLTVVGGPEGADVLVDDKPIGRTPVDPHTVCPGTHRVEVRLAGRRLWGTQVELRESTEREVTVDARPNVVLLGATEWPVGLREFAEAFNTAVLDTSVSGKDLETAEGWSDLHLPAGTDLAIAVLPRSRDGGRESWRIYSPILKTAGVLEAAPDLSRRPGWQTIVWGLRAVDSRWGGPALVMRTGAGVPDGLSIGDRILSVDGTAAQGSKDIDRLLVDAAERGTAKIEWMTRRGERAMGVLKGRRSPHLQAGSAGLAQDALRAAWAVVDAAASGDRSPAALANLALLLAHYGDHRLAVDTWRRVRFDDRAGIGEGTRQYYLGCELERLGREDDATAAFRQAAASSATTWTDEGPAVAEAARDHLADLGVRLD